ncbi:FAD dependent oxidoreductase domain-containing protein [Stackebrandtia soli]
MLIIGAGVIGAAVAHYAARAGLRVCVLESGGVAGGSTGAGEGNLLVSDKTPGPELDLALWSARLWRDLADSLGPRIEYEAKGGLVAARDDAALARLTRLAESQSLAGVHVHVVDDCVDVEPNIHPGLAGGVYYAQDAQLMPAVAAAALLATPGVDLHTGVTVTEAITSHSGRIIGVVTNHGHYSCGTVVNAAGARAGDLSAVLGAPIPVGPRRGVVLVTAAAPPLVRHKVYTADYVDDVAADDGAFHTSPVVEGTPSGPILIGASRERVGFDNAVSASAMRRLAAGAVALFPVLADVPVIRAYCGFRPYSPDHLPVIGQDYRVPGLWHATGHEGAGVGLAPATGAGLVAAITGGDADVDLTPFSPQRFEG